MKNSPLTTILLGALLLTSLGSACLCWQYATKARELRALQAQGIALQSGIQNNRAFAASLAGDAVEYSKKNPAIDPILEAIGIKAPKAAAAPAAAKK